MGMPDTIRIFQFTTILLTSQKQILNISTLLLVIQSIFTVLEPSMNKKKFFYSIFFLELNIFNMQNAPIRVIFQNSLTYIK